MWTVLKFDKKNLALLKQDLKKKLGEEYRIYIPKLRIQKFKNNKLINKDFNLLGDYLFCFHTNLEFEQNRNQLKFSKGLKPSKRGEVEIVDLLNCYKLKKQLTADLIGRGGAWLDTGSIEDFYKTSAFVSAIENRQGFKIACLEEIAFNSKWINKNHIKLAIKFYGNCDYSNYLKKLI